MRQTFWLILATAALGVFAARTIAQQPPPGGPGGPRPMNPLVRALDANGDGELSADEIEKAATALKALDRNNDGKLTEDELRPAPGDGQGGRGGFGGPGGPGAPGGRGGGRGGPGAPPEGPGGPGGAGGRGGPAPSVDEIVARYMELDANKDGKLTKDEVPERMQGLLTRADADNDGVLTKDELTQMAQRQAGGGGRGGFGGAGGGGGFGGAAGGGGGGFGGNRGGGGFGAGGFGPPNPQAFVDRAMEFDADKDGKLSKDELAKFAEQLGPPRGGPGGPGGQGGPGGPRGGGPRGGGPPDQPRP